MPSRIRPGLADANASATKAGELAGELAAAHPSLGYVRLNHDWDWQAVELEIWGWHP